MTPPQPPNIQAPDHITRERLRGLGASWGERGRLRSMGGGWAEAGWRLGGGYEDRRRLAMRPWQVTHAASDGSGSPGRGITESGSLILPSSPEELSKPPLWRREYISQVVSLRANESGGVEG